MAEQQSDPRDLSKVYPLRDLPVSESPGEVMEKMTIEVIEKKHKDYLDAWKDSPTYKKYSEIIGSKALKQGNLKVTQCMCLGTGSFTTGESGKAQLLWRVRDMAMSQLVVFESFMELLSKPRVPSSSQKHTLSNNAKRRNIPSITSISRTLSIMLWMSTFSKSSATLSFKPQSLTST